MEIIVRTYVMRDKIDKGLSTKTLQSIKESGKKLKVSCKKLKVSCKNKDGIIIEDFSGFAKIENLTTEKGMCNLTLSTLTKTLSD